MASSVMTYSSINTPSDLSAAIAAAPSQLALQHLASAAVTPHQLWLTQALKVSTEMAAGWWGQPRQQPQVCQVFDVCSTSCFISRVRTTVQMAAGDSGGCKLKMAGGTHWWLQVELLSSLGAQDAANLTKVLLFYAKLGPGYEDLFQQVML
jgi:hypothetical protein